MIPLLVAVFIASLLGSLHCAGMCGPFVAFATLRTRKDAARHGTAFELAAPALLQFAYHGGRLLSYTCLGFGAGQLGATLDLGSSMLGIGRAAGFLAGLTLVVIGVGRILGILGLKLPALVQARWLGSLVGAGHAAASRLTPTKRALVIGLLTTAIPCGWLYAFVAVAAGTGDPLRGASIMLVFWAGTVPVLAGIGAGLGAFLYRTHKAIQIVTAVLVVGLGLQSIAGRWDFDLARISSPTSSLHSAQQRVSTLLGRGQKPCH